MASFMPGDAGAAALAVFNVVFGFGIGVRGEKSLLEYKEDEQQEEDEHGEEDGGGVHF